MAWNDVVLTGRLGCTLLFSLSLVGCSDESVPQAAGSSTGAGSSEGASSGDIAEEDSGSDSGSESTAASEPAECGNGVQEGSEQCDGTDLDKFSCGYFGWGDVEGSGPLRCADDCTFDKSECQFCGDGAIEGDELCDWGVPVEGVSCESMGYGAGQVECGSSCGSFNVESCCGDGVQGSVHECDGEDLGGETCQSQGFSDGILGCNDECGFDTSGCTECGNGVLEDGESCEPGQLGELSCADVLPSRPVGELSCDPKSCEFIANDCSSCGDGVRQPDEECDPGAMEGAECSDWVPGAIGGTVSCDPRTCDAILTECHFCGDGVLQPSEECDPTVPSGATCSDWGMLGGAVPCAGACEHDLSGCTLPSAGGLVIAEIQTEGVDWFELYNPDPVVAWPLQGCWVEGLLALESFTIDDVVIVPAGGSVVIAAADDPVAIGVTPDFVPAAGMSLTASFDLVRLVCGGATIDQVVFNDAPPWPGEGAVETTLTLDAAQLDAMANDDGDSWCATAPTPAAANPTCL